MTESTKTAKEIMQELVDNFTELAKEADSRRKAASAKNENYKLEFADGERHANEGAAKKLKQALDKI